MWKNWLIEQKSKIAAVV